MKGVHVASKATSARIRSGLLLVELCLLVLPEPTHAARPSTDTDVGVISVLPGGHLAARQPARRATPWVNAKDEVPRSSPAARINSSMSERRSRKVTRSVAALRANSMDIHCEAAALASEETCPESCPYAAEMIQGTGTGQKDFCKFRCVQRFECGSLGTVENATVADDKIKSCRPCNVEGCRECIPRKPGEASSPETCKTCMPGYVMSADGRHCKSPADKIFAAIGGLTFLLVCCTVVWYVQLACKPIVNQTSLEHAYEWRQRTCLLASEETADGTVHSPYALSTNLMATNVAGPATVAYFRYQGAIIVWAGVLLLIWLGFVFGVSKDLLVLGTKPAETPRELCTVVLWGRHRLLELIWTKVTWLAIAYVFSFGGALAFSIQQARIFTLIDNAHDTMADFAAVLEGFGGVSGERKIEEELKEAVAQATSQEVVGVSVAWDYKHRAKEVQDAVEREVVEMEHHHGGGTPEAAAPNAEVEAPLANAEDEVEAPNANAEVEAPNANAEEQAEVWQPAPQLDLIERAFLRMRHVQLAGGAEEDAGHHGEEDTKKIREMLEGLSSVPKAFIVFATEDGRDKAVEAVRESGIKFGENTCTLSTEIHEPEGIQWHNLAVTAKSRYPKEVLGLGVVVLACFAWTVVLYLPYAHYMASFSYANGDEPSMSGEYLFIGLVVGSQIGLFVVTSIVVRYIQFHYHDDEQKCYIVFYNFALFLNLVMDIALQAVLSYYQMVGVGARVADGRLLGELTSLQQIFESYPIQKSMGRVLFKYCWPCTFLIPFLCEPIFAQWLPLNLGKLIIRSHPQLKGENAEKVLELVEMEQGRFADCTFNAVLVACIPFIAPAYMARTLGVFLLSHIYIYLYDHVKTLRYVTRFNFSCPEVQVFGQKLFAIPVGVLLAAFIFKANQMSAGVHGKLGEGFLRGYWLGLACIGAALLHITLHIMLIDHLVPRFAASVASETASRSYAEVARTIPATYFSRNPVHCLRSKYLLGDDPPQCPHHVGKEHLMKANPSIGSHFDGSSAKVDNY